MIMAYRRLVFDLCIPRSRNTDSYQGSRGEALKADDCSRAAEEGSQSIQK